MKLRLALIFSLVPALCQAQAARIVDSCDLVVSASRQQHAVRLTGARVVNEPEIIGALPTAISGARMSPGGKVQARLKGAANPTGAALCVSLATAPRDYGKLQRYEIRINDRLVYEASERDPGGGFKRSLFLDAPSGELNVELLTRGESEVGVTLVSLRVYDSLTISKAGQRMGLALLSSKGMGYTLDAEEIRVLARKVPKTYYLVPQAAVLYNFGSKSALENQNEIRKLTALAEKEGVPLRIAFQMGWGGTPKGVPDGSGGAYTDLPYQQIVFDQDHTFLDDSLKSLMAERYDTRYGLTTPNVWDDLPWLTYNHPRLNNFRRVRLAQALGAWQGERDRLVAAGKGWLLPGELSTGDETVYWAKGVDDKRYTELKGGKPRANLMGDFNPFTVAQAFQEGVLLDPRDGLDGKERQWLQLNLARQQQRIIFWMMDALAAEPIRLGGAEPGFALDLVRRNLYTEPYAMPLYPMADITPYQPGLENGYVLDGRSGGEYWSGARMLPWLLKSRERGRTALPNLECTAAESPQILACLQASFVTGARFATLYNWKQRPGIDEALQQFAASIEHGETVASGTAKQTGGKYAFEFVAGPNAFGANSVFVTSKEKPGEGAAIRVTIRLAGKEDHLAVVRGKLGIPCLLPTVYSLVPGSRYEAVVEIPDRSVSAPQEVAVVVSTNLLLERSRSRVLADRQDTIDLVNSLKMRHARAPQSPQATKSLEDAEKLLAANEINKAYLAGVRAEQLSLPAAFDVPTPGRELAPYPLQVDCPDYRLRAVVTTFTETDAVVTLKSAIFQRVTVRWGTYSTSADLPPNVAVEISLHRPPPPKKKR